jgi:polyisoprenoid-binding protein YceI
MTRSKRSGTYSLPLWHPSDKFLEFIRITRTALVCLLLLLAVAAASGQTKAVEAIKDESTITYQINHTLHHIEATSKDGWFRVELDPAKKEIKSVTAQVDVMTFDSGNSNRDSHAMEVVESMKYPDVTFASSSVTQNGDSLSVAGKLTFHGVTKDILMTGVAKWSQNKLDVQGGFVVSITAFKIERPALLMIPVDDALKFTLHAAFAL